VSVFDVPADNPGMSRFSELLSERDRLRRDIDIEVERLQSLRVRLATLERVLDLSEFDAVSVDCEQCPLLKKAA
jgi:hypothetical protein